MYWWFSLLMDDCGFIVQSTILYRFHNLNVQYFFQISTSTFYFSSFHLILCWEIENLIHFELYSIISLDGPFSLSWQYFCLNTTSLQFVQRSLSVRNNLILFVQGGPRTMVGIASYDSTIHFYNLRRFLQQVGK